MVVPRLAFAVPDLDKTDAALDEAAGDEHLATLQSFAIHFADVGGFLGGGEASVASSCMR